MPLEDEPEVRQLVMSAEVDVAATMYIMCNVSDLVLGLDC
jgi:hypothetical protein